MSFTRPTLTDLVDRIENDFVSRMTLSGAVLRRAVVRVVARVMAGAAHMLHGHLDFLSRQLFPDSSEDEYLLRQAGLFGLTKNPATFATGTATATGTGTPTIPAGTKLQRSDGVEYTVNADVAISAGTATLALTAVTAGSNGTLIAGVVLTFESPIAGVNSTATVIGSTVDGSDEETTDELRVRLQARLSDPPQGGNAADYVAWAKSVSGVTRVWPSPLELGPGTVVVRFVRDNDVTLIPDAGEVAAVQTYLNTVAPAHATVTAAAPTAAPINFTLHIVPDTTATRAAVTAELTDLLLRSGSPGGTVLLSDIQTAVRTASGVTDRTVTVPAADVTNATGLLPTMGTITWV